MNKFVALALGLLLLIAGAVAFWTLAGDGSRGSDPRSGDSGESPARREEVAPAALDSAATLAPEAAGRAEGPLTPAVSSRESEAGGGRIVSGRVLLPVGAPADEGLRILAFEKELTSERVYGSGGALAPEVPEEARESDLAEEGDEPADAEADERPRWIAEAPIAADGSFRLALGTDGPLFLAVDGRFLYSDPLTPLAAGAQEVRVEVKLGAALHGRVLPPEGSPDPARVRRTLKVRLGPDPAKLSLAAGRTIQTRLALPDDEGRYELRALSPDVVHVVVADGKASADRLVPGIDLEPGEARVLDLDLKLGATVRGQIVDERGTPIAGALVRAAESGMWGFAGERRAHVRSDEGGRFVLQHVPEGKLLLLASKKGYLESATQPVELVDREDRSGVTLELGRGAVLSGRVRLPDGTPAADARVHVTFDLESMMGMGAMNAARGAEGKDRCDETGRFEVTGLGKGPFTVRAALERTLDDGRKEKWHAELHKVAPDTEGLELVLSAPCVLAGRVVDPAGKPLERFRVSATQPGAVFFAAGEERSQEFVDAEGNFELRDLEPGRWQVRAKAEGFGAMAPLEVELPRTAEGPLVLALTPEASVAGIVLDPDGQPIAGARVTTPGDLAQTMARLRGTERPPEAVSDAEGHFLLRGLGPETKAIHALHERFAPSTPHPLELAPGTQVTDVTLRLARGARVTGEVYDQEGALAVDTQVIAQQRSTFEMNMTRTDARGAFAFERLSAGPWTITAMLDGSALEGASDSPDAAASFMQNLRFEMLDLAEGEEKHVVLGAPPESPVTVHGRVRHGDEPVTQGLVSFVPDGRKSLSGMKMASLGADGTFTQRLDHTGDYIVSVQVQGGASPFQQDTVEFRRSIPEVAEHTLEFELPLAGIRGSVRGPDGAAATNMRVTLTVEGGVQTGSMLGGHYAETLTDAGGRYTFRYLRPGTYTVAAGGALFGGALGTAATGGRRLRGGVTVGEGQLVEGIDFELAAPCDIKGRVRDSNGAPVADAAIFVRNADGRLMDRFSMTSSGPDGSFTYTGVEPGEYSVSARTKDRASSDSARVRVTREAPGEVELVVLAGSKLVVEVEDAEGQAVQAFISVLDSEGREVQGMIGMSEFSSAISGGFDSSQQTIGPVPPGSYTVIALGLDGKRAQKPVNLDGQAERRLRLRLKE